MDDMTPFERQLTHGLGRMGGQGRGIDAMAMAETVSSRTLRWRIQPLFGATKFVVAGVIVALFGGFLLVAQPFAQVADNDPASEPKALPPVTGLAGNGLIAFSHDGDIVVGDPLTGESEVIVSGDRGIAPLFSPDGTHIVFGRRHQLRPHSTCDLVVVGPDGSDEQVIASEEDTVGCGPVWTPDGRGIVVYGSRCPTCRGGELLFDASGAADPVPLPHDGNFGSDAVMLRPPDGDRLLLLAGSDLAVIDPDGSDVMSMTGLLDIGYEELADPVWSPDGSGIAVMAKAGHEWHLYLIGYGVRTLHRLDAIPWEVDEVSPPWSWSPDGSTIAVAHATLVEPSQESCPHKAAGRTDPCFDTMWVTLIDVESGEQRELDSTRSPGHGDGSIWDGWSWSPDGRSIVLQRSSSPRPEVVDIEADTSTELPWETDSVLSWQRIAAD